MNRNRIILAIIIISLIIIIIYHYWMYILLVIIIYAGIQLWIHKKKEKEYQNNLVKDNDDIGFCFTDKEIKFLIRLQSNINQFIENKLYSDKNIKYDDLCTNIIYELISDIYNQKPSQEKINKFIDLIAYIFNKFFSEQFNFDYKYRNHNIREKIRDMIHDCNKSHFKNNTYNINLNDTINCIRVFIMTGYIPNIQNSSSNNREKSTFTNNKSKEDGYKENKSKEELTIPTYSEFIANHNEKIFPIRLIRSLYPYNVISRIPFNSISEGDEKIIDRFKYTIRKIEKQPQNDDRLAIEFILQTIGYNEQEKWNDCFLILFSKEGKFITLYIKDGGTHKNIHSAPEMILSLLNFHFNNFNKIRRADTILYRDMYCEYLIKSIYEDFINPNNNVDYLLEPCNEIIGGFYIVNDKTKNIRFIYRYEKDEANALCRLLAKNKSDDNTFVIYFSEGSPFNNSDSKDSKAWSILKFLNEYSNNKLSKNYFEEKILFLLNDLSSFPQEYTIENVEKCYIENDSSKRNLRNPLPEYLVNDAWNTINSIINGHKLNTLTKGEKFHLLSAFKLVRSYINQNQKKYDNNIKNHAFSIFEVLFKSTIEYWFNTRDNDVILSYCLSDNKYYTLCNIQIKNENIQFSFQIKDENIPLSKGNYNMNKPMQNIAAEVYMWAYYYKWTEQCKRSANYNVSIKEYKELYNKNKLYCFLDMVYIKNYKAANNSSVCLRSGFLQQISREKSKQIDYGSKHKKGNIIYFCIDNLDII